MPIFNTVGHFIAFCFKKIISGSAAVAKDAQLVENAVESPVITALTQLGGTKGAQVQDDALALVGAVVKAASDIGVAAVAKGLNIADDEIAVQALENLVSTAAGLFGKSVTPKVTA